jgi:predicted dehydrogenase
VTDHDPPISWGVLSTANIAVEKVIPAMKRSGLSRVDAIASRSAERAASVATALDIPRSYGSYEELLADTDVEALYIPLPNHLHPEWTIAAAEAGKHILCEKPLAMTSAEARTMIAACEAADVHLMEAFMYRLHPLWVKAMVLIEEGVIGDVCAVRTIFSYFNDDPGDIRNMTQTGGGALYDIGCYAVSVARLVFGSEPTSVKSSIKRDERFSTDILTSAVLDFGGRHASFVCSTQMEPDQRVDIYGTEGRLVVEIPFNIPPDRPTRLLQVAGGSPPVAPDTVVHEVETADPYTVEADAFSRAILEGSPVPVSPMDAVANLEVIEAIFADGGA